MQSVVGFLKLQFTPSPPASCPPLKPNLIPLDSVRSHIWRLLGRRLACPLWKLYPFFHDPAHICVLSCCCCCGRPAPRKSHDSVPERRGIFNPELLGEQVLPNNSFVSSTVVLDSWAGIEKVHCLQIRWCCCCTFLGWLCLGLGGLIECVCCFESWLRWPPPEKGFIDVVW